MKCFLLFTVAIIAVSTVYAINDTENYEDGDRYFHFPGDGDGILHLVDTMEEIDHDFVNNYLRSAQNNVYLLFTRYNTTTPQVLTFDDIASVQASYFDFSKVTIFLAHGWKGNGTNNMNLLLTEAFLQDGDVNVIVLDWSRLANKNYLTAKKGVAEAGKGLGQFINWLATLGVSYNKIHLVGFSLGAHLVGNAGRAANSKVKRITCLDPAGPLWRLDENRVAPTDSQYIEVIHTNAHFMGMAEPCGHADFYPNGGSNMKGCILLPCSHSRAYKYMASSVKHNHLLANECNTLKEVTQDKCQGDLYPMGNSDLTKSRSGIFRVNTKEDYPY